MKYWRHDEEVDGGGFVLAEHARRLAVVLRLTPGQCAVLVAELRNALVPDLTSGVPKGAERVLALADALVTLSRSP